MEVGGGTEESPWNDEWRWVEGQRRARGMMNGGGGGTEESPWNDEWRWVEGQRRAHGMMEWNSKLLIFVLPVLLHYS